jgi:hypothetical protein
MRFLASLLFCGPLLAQSFQIVPSAATPGGSGSLLITLTSPAGKEPVALQWKITIETEVTVGAADIVAGDAATAAGKTVTCAPDGKAEGGKSAYKCILVGGVKNIANGTVFRVKYQVKPGTRPRTLPVSISGGLAGLQHGNQLEPFPIPPVEGTIRVR